MVDADAEGFTVAVVPSTRLFKDAAADPTLVPNPKIGLSFLAVFDHFLGIPGEADWSALSHKPETAVCSSFEYDLSALAYKTF